MFKVARSDGVTVIFPDLGSGGGGKISKSNSLAPQWEAMVVEVAQTLPVLPRSKRGVADLGDLGDVFYVTEVADVRKP